MIDPQIVQLAEQHCYPRQLQVWKLHHQHRMSFRAIALHLGISRTTVTDSYDGACARLLKVGVHIDASGNPHLKETTAA